VSSTVTSNIEKLLHVFQPGGEPVIGKTVEKYLAVALPCDAIIEQDQHSTVRTAANQPPESLLECDGGLRNLVIVKWITALLPDTLNSRAHHRIVRHRKRQLINDNAAQLLARHIHSLP